MEVESAAVASAALQSSGPVRDQVRAIRGGSHGLPTASVLDESGWERRGSYVHISHLVAAPVPLSNTPNPSYLSRLSCCFDVDRGGETGSFGGFFPAIYSNSSQTFASE